MLLDQYFRSVDELFDPRIFDRLSSLYRIEGGADEPMSEARRNDLLPEAEVYIAARPQVGAADVKTARNLKAVIEVSGAFHEGIDYQACLDQGIEVLSCAPGFRRAVAEMGLAMILSGARGLVIEHEAFRRGEEAWLDDMPKRDFTLYGRKVGFVGYGNISTALHKLLLPFSPQVSFFDPWVNPTSTTQKCDDLKSLFSSNRVVVIASSPTSENRHAIGVEEIGAMMPGALLVLLSRAHVIDFPVALSAAASGHITFATDVFPSEPVPSDHSLRTQPGVILSPHRAAAVAGGRHLIGEMILHDLEAMRAGRLERKLQPADPARVASLIAAQRDIEQDGSFDAT